MHRINRGSASSKISCSLTSNAAATNDDAAITNDDAAIAYDDAIATYDDVAAIAYDDAIVTAYDDAAIVASDDATSNVNECCLYSHYGISDAKLALHPPCRLQHSKA